MKTFTLTLTLVILVSYAGNALGENRRAYAQARASLARINFLVMDGPTDSDAQEIDKLMGSLPSLRKELTSEQQSQLWEKYPWFAGIACNWAVGHGWQGNDCAFQCGSFQECQKGIEP
jgi:hypothetical protein